MPGSPAKTVLLIIYSSVSELELGNSTKRIILEAPAGLRGIVRRTGDSLCRPASPLEENHILNEMTLGPCDTPDDLQVFMTLQYMGQTVKYARDLKDFEIVLVGPNGNFR